MARRVLFALAKKPLAVNLTVGSGMRCRPYNGFTLCVPAGGAV